MNKEEIIKNLKTIGIQFKSQLDKNDINFWWQKKYTEILKSDLENKNELLISLNNALEELEKIDFEKIKSEIETKPVEKKTKAEPKTGAPKETKGKVKAQTKADTSKADAAKTKRTPSKKTAVKKEK